MRTRFLRSGRNGFALFFVIIVIITISVFGGLLIIMGINRSLLNQLEIDRLKAVFLAEAGISQAIYEMKTQKDEHLDGVGNIKKKELGEGYFTVMLNSRTGEIISTGVVNEVRRTLQIKYSGN